MERNTQMKRAPVWLLLLATFASLLGLVLPLLCAVAPALWAAALIRKNRGASVALPALPFVLSGLLYALMQGAEGARDSLVSLLCLSALGTVPAFAIVRVQTRKKGGFYTAAAAGGLCALFLYLALCLPGVLSGAGAFAAVQQSTAELGELFLAILSQVPKTERSAAVMETFTLLFEALPGQIPALLVSWVLQTGCFMGLSNTLLFRLLVRKEREELGLAPMKRFSEWGVPREFTVGLVVLLLGSILLTVLETEYAQGVSAAVTAVVSFPLLVQALAVVDFFLLRKPANLAVKRTLIYLASGFLLMMGMQSVFIMIGCFEQVFRIREKADMIDRYRQKPPQTGPGGPR